MRAFQSNDGVEWEQEVCEKFHKVEKPKIFPEANREQSIFLLLFPASTGIFFIPVQTDTQRFGPQVPPPGKMRLVISPNGHWIGVCIACHKLLKQSLFPEKVVLSCPQCRCCITVKMDMVLDQIISAQHKNERVVLLFNSIG